MLRLSSKAKILDIQLKQLWQERHTYNHSYFRKKFIMQNNSLYSKPQIALRALEECS